MAERISKDRDREDEWCIEFKDETETYKCTYANQVFQLKIHKHFVHEFCLTSNNIYRITLTAKIILCKQSIG